MIKNCTILFLLVIVYPAWGQSFGFKNDLSTEVIVEGQRLPTPWVGGLNSPQFSKMHLNADTIEDLVIFDRTSNRLTTYIAQQQPNGYVWQYAPQFEKLFPANIANWLLLVDYDKDGRKDIFTSGQAGIKVYQNIATANGFGWRFIIDPIRTEGFSGNINLYVQATDLPAITDLDDDGDIDILTFDFSGNSIEYHQNFSVENGRKTPFEFRKVSTCWGKFVKEHCNDFRFDQPCETVLSNGRTARIMHAGNAMWVGDLNGDGHKDILHGHITCTNIAKINGIGSNDAKARMGSFDKVFPAAKPIDFKVFPSTYVEDVTFDGKPDLIVAPSVYYNENNLVDMRASVWLYRNDGTAKNTDFRFLQSNFLQKDMLDLGENTSPALYDYDGDGDADLFVGFGGLATPKGYRASIWYFKNIGTKQKAVFELITTDFLGLGEQFQVTNIKPFFADIDQNGTIDFGYSATNLNGMEIRYISNAAPRSLPMRLENQTIKSLPIPLYFSNNETIAFFDADQNGTLDVLVGKGTGNIELNDNIGSNMQPVYKLKNEKFGGFGVNFNSRTPSLILADFNADLEPEWMVANAEGFLKIMTSTKTDSTLILNEFTNQNEYADLGSGLNIAAADLDGDNLPDLVLGHITGGLTILKNTSKPQLPNTNQASKVEVYPNPAATFIYVKSSEKTTVELINVKGQVLKNLTIVVPNNEYAIEIVDLPSGTYFVRFNAQSTTTKIVINR